jgi:hypothetical protein
MTRWRYPYELHRHDWADLRAAGKGVMMDLSTTIEADSTQLNAVDLTGSSRIVTITGVAGGPDKKQPVNIQLAEFPDRAYRPCKSMRRILVHAWGTDASTYVGRRMELYNDESVKWGGRAVGGIRIKALSHIEARFDKTLQESQKSYVTYSIERLPDAPAQKSKAPTAASIIGAFDSLGVTVEQLELKVGADHEKWTADDIAGLAALGKAIKAGTTTTFEEFEPVEPAQTAIEDGVTE